MSFSVSAGHETTLIIICLSPYYPAALNINIRSFWSLMHPFVPVECNHTATSCRPLMLLKSILKYDYIDRASIKMIYVRRPCLKKTSGAIMLLAMSGCLAVVPLCLHTKPYPYLGQFYVSPVFSTTFLHPRPMGTISRCVMKSVWPHEDQFHQ